MKDAGDVLRAQVTSQPWLLLSVKDAGDILRAQVTSPAVAAALRLFLAPWPPAQLPQDSLCPSRVDGGRGSGMGAGAARWEGNSVSSRVGSFPPSLALLRGDRGVSGVPLPAAHLSETHLEAASDRHR